MTTANMADDDDDQWPITVHIMPADRTATEPLRSINLDVPRTANMEYVFKTVEARFTIGYAQDAKTHEVFCKVLQNRRRADLSMTQKVSVQFRDHDPKEDRILYMTTGYRDQNCSVAPGSMMWPEGYLPLGPSMPRTAQQQLQNVQRRRIQRERFGSALDDINADTPIESFESRSAQQKEQDEVRVDGEGFKIPQLSNRASDKKRKRGRDMPPLVLAEGSQSRIQQTKRPRLDDQPSPRESATSSIDNNSSPAEAAWDRVNKNPSVHPFDNARSSQGGAAHTPHRAKTALPTPTSHEAPASSMHGTPPSAQRPRNASAPVADRSPPMSRRQLQHPLQQELSTQNVVEDEDDELLHDVTERAQYDDNEDEEWMDIDADDDVESDGGRRLTKQNQHSRNRPIEQLDLSSNRPPSSSAPSLHTTGATPSSSQLLPSNKVTSTPANKAWTTAEDKQLLRGLRKGWTAVELGNKYSFDRTASSIRNRLALMRRDFPGGVVPPTDKRFSPDRSSDEEPPPKSTGKRANWTVEDTRVLTKAIADGYGATEIQSRFFSSRTHESVSKKFGLLEDGVIKRELRSGDFPLDVKIADRWTGSHWLKLRRAITAGLAFTEAHGKMFTTIERSALRRRWNAFKSLHGITVSSQQSPRTDEGSSTVQRQPGSNPPVSSPLAPRTQTEKTPKRTQKIQQTLLSRTPHSGVSSSTGQPNGVVNSPSGVFRERDQSVVEVRSTSLEEQHRRDQPRKQSTGEPAEPILETQLATKSPHAVKRAAEQGRTATQSFTNSLPVSRQTQPAIHHDSNVHDATPVAAQTSIAASHNDEPAAQSMSSLTQTKLQFKRKKGKGRATSVQPTRAELGAVVAARAVASMAGYSAAEVRKVHEQPNVLLNGAGSSRRNGSSTGASASHKRSELVGGSETAQDGGAADDFVMESAEHIQPSAHEVERMQPSVDAQRPHTSKDSDQRGAEQPEPPSDEPHAHIPYAGGAAMPDDYQDTELDEMQVLIDSQLKSPERVPTESSPSIAMQRSDRGASTGKLTKVLRPGSRFVRSRPKPYLLVANELIKAAGAVSEGAQASSVDGNSGAEPTTTTTAGIRESKDESPSLAQQPGGVLPHAQPTSVRPSSVRSSTPKLKEKRPRSSRPTSARPTRAQSKDAPPASAHKHNTLSNGARPGSSHSQGASLSKNITAAQLLAQSISPSAGSPRKGPVNSPHAVHRKRKETQTAVVGLETDHVLPEKRARVVVEVEASTDMEVDAEPTGVPNGTAPHKPTSFPTAPEPPVASGSASAGPSRFPGHESGYVQGQPYVNGQPLIYLLTDVPQQAPPETWPDLPVRPKPREKDMYTIGDAPFTSQGHLSNLIPHSDEYMMKRAVKVANKKEEPEKAQEYFDFAKLESRCHWSLSCKHEAERARLWDVRRRLFRAVRMRNGWPSAPRRLKPQFQGMRHLPDDDEMYETDTDHPAWETMCDVLSDVGDEEGGDAVSMDDYVEEYLSLETGQCLDSRVNVTEDVLPTDVQRAWTVVSDEVEDQVPIASAKIPSSVSSDEAEEEGSPVSAKASSSRNEKVEDEVIPIEVDRASPVVVCGSSPVPEDHGMSLNRNVSFESANGSKSADSKSSTKSRRRSYRKPKGGEAGTSDGLDDAEVDSTEISGAQALEAPAVPASDDIVPTIEPHVPAAAEEQVEQDNHRQRILEATPAGGKPVTNATRAGSILGTLIGSIVWPVMQITTPKPRWKPPPPVIALPPGFVEDDSSSSSGSSSDE